MKKISNQSVDYQFISLIYSPLHFTEGNEADSDSKQH